MMGNEDRYAAALLYAGAEPADEESPAHMKWQSDAVHILLYVYRNHWWFNHEEMLWDETVTPAKHKQALEIKADVSRDELTKFYTWVCNDRREQACQREINRILLGS